MNSLANQQCFASILCNDDVKHLCFGLKSYSRCERYEKVVGWTKPLCSAIANVWEITVKMYTETLETFSFDIT